MGKPKKIPTWSIPKNAPRDKVVVQGKATGFVSLGDGLEPGWAEEEEAKWGEVPPIGRVQ